MSKLLQKGNSGEWEKILTLIKHMASAKNCVKNSLLIIVFNPWDVRNPWYLKKIFWETLLENDRALYESFTWTVTESHVIPIAQWWIGEHYLYSKSVKIYKIGYS